MGHDTYSILLCCSSCSISSFFMQQLGAEAGENELTPTTSYVSLSLYTL